MKYKKEGLSHCFWEDERNGNAGIGKPEPLTIITIRKSVSRCKIYWRFLLKTCYVK